MSAIPVIEDKTLVLQLRNNSVNAFDSLFCKYSNKLYGFAFSLLKNQEDSKEIVQEAFPRIWDKRHLLSRENGLPQKEIAYNLLY